MPGCYNDQQWNADTSCGAENFYDNFFWSTTENVRIFNESESKEELL